MNMLRDLKHALRTLRKTPGFAFVAIATLALAIGANTAVFSLIKGAYFDSLPYPDSKNLLVLSATFPALNGAEEPISGPLYLAVREQSRSLEHVSALVGASFTLTGEGDAVRFRGLRASASMFRMVGVPPALGRVFTEEEQQPGRDRVAVISHQLWQGALGGRTSVLGSEIQLNDVTHTIIGVMPPRFRYGDNDVWTPLSIDLARQGLTERMIYLQGRLAPGYTVESVNAELAGIASRLERDLLSGSPEFVGWRLRARALIDEVLRDVKPALATLLAAVGCILLIACANLSNLQLARNFVREREMAVRLALGARRADIVRQLLIESGLLAILGAGAGVLLAWWSLDAVLRLIPYTYIPIEAEVKIDAAVLLATVAISVATVLLSGLYPAWNAARPALNSSLKDARGASGAAARHRGVQRLMVVAQIALTFVVLIASTLMLKSFARLARLDPGFDPDNVHKVEMILPLSRYAEPATVRAFYDTLLRNANSVPGIESAGAATVLPLAMYSSGSPIAIEGLSRDELGSIPFAEQRQVTPGHHQPLKMSLLRGLDFSEADTAETLPVAIVNETFVAKYFPTADVIGRRVRRELPGTDSQWMTIVGVVKDVRQLRMSDPVAPEVYRPHAQAPNAARRMTLVLRSNLEHASILQTVRELVRKQDSGVAIFDAQPMHQYMAHSLGGQKLAVVLLAFFGGLALLLTVLGIYGIVAYFVRHRTGEIGIRMALGAQRVHILRLILGQSTSVALLGIVFGLGGALAATRIIRSLLFEVSASDLFSYLTVVACLAVATLLASYLPARAALRLNPLQALHHD